ncbi:hypothetical protein [Glaciihabitans tibetensis]|uniref:hypothetical protein n=1 Tax=Glaciihabitans tibetensis TaxID=1266600 RepID=UPI0015E745F5|nr:hypothetical protein [Glaciihabitans tibetensis]
MTHATGIVFFFLIHVGLLAALTLWLYWPGLSRERRRRRLPVFYSLLLGILIEMRSWA